MFAVITEQMSENAEKDLYDFYDKDGILQDCILINNNDLFNYIDSLGSYSDIYIAVTNAYSVKFKDESGHLHGTNVFGDAVVPVTEAFDIISKNVRRNAIEHSDFFKNMCEAGCGEDTLIRIIDKYNFSMDQLSESVKYLITDNKKMRILSKIINKGADIHVEGGKYVRNLFMYGDPRMIKHILYLNIISSQELLDEINIQLKNDGNLIKIGGVTNPYYSSKLDMDSRFKQSLEAYLCGTSS